MGVVKGRGGSGGRRREKKVKRRVEKKVKGLLEKGVKGMSEGKRTG